MDLAQYHTAGDLLSAVLYDTARSQSRKTRLTWLNLNKNQKYFNSFLNGPGRLELWIKIG